LQVEHSEFLTVLGTLATALGCGLLMGIERERRKGQGPQRALAGVRSFTLAALAGACAALIDATGLVAVGAAFIAALTVVAYARERSDDPGVTTEIALLLAYLIGVLCLRDRVLAAALAVVVTGLLAARDTLHQFSRDWLRPAEVRGGLVLGALALLVMPLLPDRPLWGPVLNPQVVLRLLLVLLVIQSLAHVGKRLLQARHAVALSALASGFVSSTATIGSLGMEARAGMAPVRRQAGAALLSCVATMAQIMAVAATVQPAWVARLWLPALAGGLVALAWGGWLVWRSTATTAASAAGPHGVALPPDTDMFRLRDAALIALLLTGIQALVHGLGLWLGDAGMLAGTLLAALADVHSATAAVLVQGGPQDAVGPGLERALMAALLVHSASKSVVAGASGGWRYAVALVPGVLAHTLAFVGVLALL
jgi:uncharacterized membrane protein (DUF4010 family)